MSNDAKNDKALDALLSGLQSRLMGNNRKGAVEAFDKFYFSTFPTYSIDQIKLVFKGNSKYKTGLCHVCGLLKGSGKQFRVASGRALSLVGKLLDSKTNRDAANYIKVFTTLPAATIALMKLADHNTDPGGNVAVAQILEDLLRTISAPSSKKSITQGTTVAANTVHEMLSSSRDVKLQPKRLSVKPMPATSKLTGFSGMMSAFLKRRPDQNELLHRGVIKVRHVFGQALSVLASTGHSDAAGVPLIVKELIEVLTERKAWELEGLFRISGNQTEILAVKNAIDFKEPYSFARMQNTHSLSGLLKLFIRELPEPLLMHRNYDSLCEAYRAADYAGISAIVSSLEPRALNMWNYLLDFLMRLNANETVNMMTAKNIAIVMAPNVLRAQVESLAKIQMDTPITIGVVEYLLLKHRHDLKVYVASDYVRLNLYARVFGVPEGPAPGVSDDTGLRGNTHLRVPSMSSPISSPTHVRVPSQTPTAHSTPLRGLPRGWAAKEDPSSKRTYYVNTETKERQWAHPGVPLTGNGGNSATNKVAGQDDSDDEIAAGLLQALRKEREEEEKKEAKSGASPDAKAGSPEAALDAYVHKPLSAVFDDDVLGNNLNPHDSGNTLVLPQNWFAVVDPASKHTYYVNTVTRESSWTPPAGTTSRAVKPLSSTATAKTAEDKDDSDDEHAAGLLQALRKEREEEEKKDALEEKADRTNRGSESKAPASEAALDAFVHMPLPDELLEEDDPLTQGDLLTSACLEPVHWWESVFHQPSDRCYYINPCTNETVWKLPPSANPAYVVNRGLSTVNPGYHVISVEGRWDETTAGGCFPNFDSWRKNSQYRLVLKPPHLTASVRASIEWLWEGPPPPPPAGKTVPRHPAIGLYVFHNEGPSQQLLQVLPESIVARGPFKTSGDISCEFKIELYEPGLGSFLEGDHKKRNGMDFPTHYTIVPSTFEPQQFGRFRLTVQSSRDVSLVPVTAAEIWAQQTLRSEWKGPTAGGCRNNHMTWANNPKFSIASNVAQVMLIKLSLDSDSAEATGVYVVGNDGQVISKGHFVVAKDLFCQIEFFPLHGPFVIIPSTFSPGVEMPFTLTVMAPGQFTLSNQKN